MTSRRRLATLFVISGLVFSLASSVGAQVPPGGTFTDDDGNTHEGDIEAVAAAGITRGCNPPFNDRYCPDDEVTRGQMAAFIRRALGIPAATSDHFDDDNGSTFESDINAIAEINIARGCNPPSNDRFCPNEPVTRGQMAALLRRAYELPSTSTDHFDDDNGSTFESDINAIAEDGITRGCNPPANSRYCPGESVERDQMASFLARAENLTSEVPPDRADLDWELVVGGLSQPVQALAPPGEDRLLIAEQGGLVRSFENGSLSTFLDIRNQVTFGGERGLLSIAVHPDYPDDRRLFAWYYGTDDRTYLVEYDIAADLGSASSPRTVLSVAQPATNHNGGYVVFGDDGYLYLSLGDGGGSNDAFENARDLSTLLGKIIRIDVDGANPYEIPPDNPYVGQPSRRPEIWASGLRNPWRFSFDAGYIFIGDVGQGAREEIDVVRVANTGYDFGWSRFEGSLCNPDDHDSSCSGSGLVFPVAEYGRSAGRTVTGGIVYRGPTISSLSGYYLYADVFSGLIRGFRHLDGQPVAQVDLTSNLGMAGIVDFAEDGDGELLIVSLFDNSVYRLTGG
jgi:glucose/arabinose dehydrogenase